MQITSFIDGEAYTSGASFQKLNPYTGESLHAVASCDLLGLVRAIQSANRAFPQWKGSTAEERAALVRKLRDALEKNLETYARAEALDQGLPLSFVREHSLRSTLRYMDGKIEELRTFRPADDITYAPVGVVALVGSWNLSLRVLLERLFPALLAGNSCVVKVSSQSPVSAWILAELLREAAVPQGLVNVIVSADADVKKALVAHPGVRAVTLAGRLETAASVLNGTQQAALQNFRKVQISSGTKNSAVALGEPEDGVFQAVLRSFLLGQGQLAWNSARLFILEKHESLWKERLQAALAELRPAESIEDDSLWTPCLKQESFEKFGELARLATEDQAKLLQTPHPLTERQKGLFLPPVFTQDMSRCSTLQQDQVHSPFYILSAVKYPFDVAKYSNVSYFGFAGHLWGEPEKLRKVAEALDVGLVTYNGFSAEVPGPVTAVKQSGCGQQNFQIFGDFFSNVKKSASVSV